MNDAAQRYETAAGRPFAWIRGRQLGGRTLLWGGVTLRLSDYELQAAGRDGYGPAWPIRYRDLAPYYDRVERFLGIHGTTEGLPQLPDGLFAGARAAHRGGARGGRRRGRRLARAADDPVPAAWPSSSTARPPPACPASGRPSPRRWRPAACQIRTGAAVSHLIPDGRGAGAGRGGVRGRRERRRPRRAGSPDRALRLHDRDGEDPADHAGGASGAAGRRVGVPGPLPDGPRAHRQRGGGGRRSLPGAGPPHRRGLVPGPTVSEPRRGRLVRLVRALLARLRPVGGDPTSRVRRPARARRARLGGRARGDAGAGRQPRGAAGRPQRGRAAPRAHRLRVGGQRTQDARGHAGVHQGGDAGRRRAHARAVRGHGRAARRARPAGSPGAVLVGGPARRLRARGGRRPHGQRSVRLGGRRAQPLLGAA